MSSFLSWFGCLPFTPRINIVILDDGFGSQFQFVCFHLSLPFASTLCLYPLPLRFVSTLCLYPLPLPFVATLCLYPLPLPLPGQHCGSVNGAIASHLLGWGLNLAPALCFSLVSSCSPWAAAHTLCLCIALWWSGVPSSCPVLPGICSRPVVTLIRTGGLEDGWVECNWFVCPGGQWWKDFKAVEYLSKTPPSVELDMTEIHRKKSAKYNAKDIN